MSNVLYSLILTSLAGLSTLIGYFAIFIKGDKNKIISFSLAFASGVMSIICFIDLIPSAHNYLNNYVLVFRILYILCFIILGFYLSSFFDKHLTFNTNNNSLYRVGFLTMLGIIIHNIPEGIITFMVSQVDKSIGLTLAIAISLHNIPEGISISIPLYYSTKNKLYTFMLVLIAGCSELIGGVISLIFFKDFITDTILGIIFSLIAGIMLNISLFNLLKESYQYNKKISFIGYLLGGIVMIISHFVM